MLKIDKLKEEVKKAKVGHGAWNKGIKAYAFLLLDGKEDYIKPNYFCNREELEKILLNGSQNWKQYSYDSGCALTNSVDIAKLLCSPTEFKRKREGRIMPNLHETWFDVQARALNSASDLIFNIVEKLKKKE